MNRFITVLIEALITAPALFQTVEPAPVSRLAPRQPTQERPLAGILDTIAGPGGIGKTALAVGVAEQRIEAYEHGVWLIDLASVSDPLLIPKAIVSAVGLEARAEHPLAALIASLRNKHMLLVFDNCEHVIAAAAELATKILRGAPSVQIIATSREPLRAEGEHLYRLAPLASPPASLEVNAREALSFPAVELFVAHAAASLGEFELDDADASIVAEICRRLDGVPLAIKLAAARVGTIGVRGVAARMEDSLTLLTGGHRSAPPRQLTMGATLDWSYGLLTELEQSVFRRLSVFAGSFTLQEAATAATHSSRSEREIIDNVLELVAKSLIIADRDDPEQRLWLLETTRAYARIRLAETGGCDSFTAL